MRLPQLALVMAALCLGTAACARMEAEEAKMDPSMRGTKVSLAQYPGAESQIRDYYESHAQEGDDNCGAVNMGAITRVSEIINTASQLELAVHYEFSSEDSMGRPEYCKMGFNTRIVTFSKTTSGLVFQKMSGELGAA